MENSILVKLSSLLKGDFRSILEPLKKKIVLIVLYIKLWKNTGFNFYVELIEETNNPEEREQFWIRYYNSYVGFSNCQGYNATLGGDGKAYIDREPIIELF